MSPTSCRCSTPRPITIGPERVPVKRRGSSEASANSTASSNVEVRPTIRPRSKASPAAMKTCRPIRLALELPLAEVGPLLLGLDRSPEPARAFRSSARRRRPRRGGPGRRRMLCRSPMSRATARPVRASSSDCSGRSISMAYSAAANRELTRHQRAPAWSASFALWSRSSRASSARPSSWAMVPSRLSACASAQGDRSGSRLGSPR